MPTKTISTQQTQQVVDATHFLHISDVAAKLFNIEGEVNSTTGTNYYIQLLTVPYASASSGVTKPIYSRLCVLAASSTGINGFSFTYGPAGVDTLEMAATVTPALDVSYGGRNLPLYVAISSTDAVWTSVAAATNVAVDLEMGSPEPVNAAQVGDLTTLVNAITVWADGAGANLRLVRLKVVPNSTNVYYVMQFGYNPSNGATPEQQWTLPSSTDKPGGIDLFFSTEGFLSMQNNPTTLAKTNGCYFLLSSTTQVLTIGATDAYIKAWTVPAAY